MSDEKLTRRDALLGLGATALVASSWPMRAFARPPRPPHPSVFVRRSLPSLGGLDPKTFEYHQVRWNVKQLIRLGPGGTERLLDQYFKYATTVPLAVFAMIRGLYEPPTKAHPQPSFENVARRGYLRPPALGAPSPGMPVGLEHTPHYPVLWLGDFPVSLVEGYQLGGLPESAKMHFEALKTDGVFRRKALPETKTRAQAEALLGGLSVHLSASHQEMAKAQIARAFKVSGP